MPHATEVVELEPSALILRGAICVQFPRVTGKRDTTAQVRAFKLHTRRSSEPDLTGGRHGDGAQQLNRGH